MFAVLPLQAKVRAISEIVDQLVAGVKESRDVNLPLVRRDACAKYSLARAPKLVEIISAVPDDYRDLLLPRRVSKELVQPYNSSKMCNTILVPFASMTFAQMAEVSTAHQPLSVQTTSYFT